MAAAKSAKPYCIKLLARNQPLRRHAVRHRTAIAVAIRSRAISLTYIQC